MAMKQNNSVQSARVPVAQFTPEMKKTHTILIPMMLPIHFEMIEHVLRKNGYRTELLRNEGSNIATEGLKNVHNDTCYPALLVIGQMMDALHSGKYDPHKIAFMITQTGGGCRASNYIYLLRKALVKSGYGYIPVVAINFAALGNDSESGFQITIPMLYEIAHSIVMGDMLMCLHNQCRPYELHPGDTDRVTNKWIGEINRILDGKASTLAHRLLACYPQIVKDYDNIHRAKERKIRVGVVGEIYVKYSPLGNNNLERFLISEGAEPVVPGLMDFMLYCVYNGIEDQQLYGGSRKKTIGSQLLYRYLVGKQRQVIKAIRKQGSFNPPGCFADTLEMVEGYISKGVKMGEGWLLTAEMVELIHSGVDNIVCTQPFGCLPNHIAGKGMIRAIKEKNPDPNIIAVDYDPGASEVNQENRIKLMLATAAVREKEKKRQAQKKG